MTPPSDAPSATSDPNAPRLAMRGVRHSFAAGGLERPVLRDLDLQVRAGEIVMLLGPSGSGKTTLLTLAGALRRVQAGSVRVNGLDLAAAGPDQLPAIRRGIGFVFQNQNLLKALTCLENITVSMACDVRETAASARAKARLTLAQVGLAHLADAMPGTLSQGQRQRVALARAVVHGPGLILADEPTASLDAESGRGVVDLLRDHAHRRTCAILLATHDPRILDAADRILALEDGRLVAAG